MDFSESHYITEVVVSLRFYLQLVRGHGGTLASSCLTSNFWFLLPSLWFAPKELQRSHQPDAQGYSDNSWGTKACPEVQSHKPPDFARRMTQDLVSISVKIFILFFRPNRKTKDEVEIFMGTGNSQDWVAFEHSVWLGIRAIAITAA